MRSNVNNHGWCQHLWIIHNIIYTCHLKTQTWLGGGHNGSCLSICITADKFISFATGTSLALVSDGQFQEFRRNFAEISSKFRVLLMIFLQFVVVYHIFLNSKLIINLFSFFFFLFALTRTTFLMLYITFILVSSEVDQSERNEIYSCKYL